MRMLSIIGPLRFVGTLAEGGGDPQDVVETTCDDVGERANSRANNSVSSCPRPSRRVSCLSVGTTDDLQICDILGFLGNGQDDLGSPYGSEGWGVRIPPSAL